MKRSLIVALVGFMICLTAGCSSENSSPTEPQGPGLPGGLTWRLLESGIQGNMNAIASNTTTLVAAGDGPRIYSTSDGIEWIERASPIGVSFEDVCRSDDLFLAVGQNGMMMSSPDGVAWRRESAELPTHFRGVSHFDSLYLAVGNSGVVISSRDAETWEVDTLPGDPDLYDVVNHDSLWVTCGSDGAIRFSNNAISWSAAATVFPTDILFRQLAQYRNELFVFGSQPVSGDADRTVVYSSGNGTNWFFQAAIDSATVNGALSINGEFVAVGEFENPGSSGPKGLLLRSADGSAWNRTLTEVPGKLSGLSELDSAIVIVGDDGFVLGGSSINDLEITGSGSLVSDLDWTGSQFIGVSQNGTIVTSQNGLTWTERHSGVSEQLLKVVFSGNNYVAMGEFGDLYVSSDGQDWTQTRIQDFSFLTEDLTWGDGSFVVVGSRGLVLTSADGMNWNETTIAGEASLRSVAWNGTNFVAFASTEIYASPDATSWTIEAHQTSSPFSFERIIYRDGMFWAIGASTAQPVSTAAFAYSDDLANWDVTDLGRAERLFDLEKSGPNLFVVGQQGLLMRTTNLQNWEQISTGTDQLLVSLATSGSRLVAMGRNRTILVSP